MLFSDFGGIFCKLFAAGGSNILVMAEAIGKTPAETANGVNTSDLRLVERFRKGDRVAFEEIVGANAPDVAALANRLLGWAGEVEDVVQDVFLAAYLGLKNFRCQSSIKTWLFTITTNKCRRRRYKRMLRLRLRTGLTGGSEAEAENGLIESETFGRVRRAVRRLPAKYREAVVLRYLQELSSDEITRILGISRAALNTRLSRARERLRGELAELMDE